MYIILFPLWSRRKIFSSFSRNTLMIQCYWNIHFSKREEIALKFECILPCKSIYDSFARTVPDRKFTHKCDRFKRIVGELQTLSSSWINNLSKLFPCNVQWEETRMKNGCNIVDWKLKIHCTNVIWRKDSFHDASLATKCG